MRTGKIGQFSPGSAILPNSVSLLSLVGAELATPPQARKGRPPQRRCPTQAGCGYGFGRLGMTSLEGRQQRVRYTTASTPGESIGVSEKKKGAKLFPMFLKIAGRACLVVGAGAIAESKIASLVEAGANVRVIAPEATERVRVRATEKKIEWQKREFQVEDLAGMFLVVAATSSRELHEEIFKEARQRGVLCNIVDVPELCDFYYPAVVQRGALQIAISTSGRSPALAQRLRKELEEKFGPEYEDWMEHLGNARDEQDTEDSDPQGRKRLRHEQASAKAFDAFRRKRKNAKSKSK